MPAALLGHRPAALRRARRRLAADCREADESTGIPASRSAWRSGSRRRHGRDKLTLILAPEIAALGAWLEQLVAESTGKLGQMILPIDGELLAAARTGTARTGSSWSCATPGGSRTSRRTRSRRSSLPVFRSIEIDCADLASLGAEFFRWEFATAVAGALLGVHPFDQPDVEAAKVAARTAHRSGRGDRRAAGRDARSTPSTVSSSSPTRTRPRRSSSPPTNASLRGLLAAHLDRARPGDYVALCAFLEMSAENEAAMAELRHAAVGESLVSRRPSASVRGSSTRPARPTRAVPPPASSCSSPTSRPPTCRFPGRRLTFGQVIAAQARGDFEVLSQRGRRHLRLHFPDGAAAGWQALERAWRGERSRE